MYKWPRSALISFHWASEGVCRFNPSPPSGEASPIIEPECHDHSIRCLDGGTKC